MTADLPRRRIGAWRADPCDRAHRVSDVEPHDHLAVRDVGDQLDRVGEVDRVAVVELRRERRPDVDRARVKDVLDRLPVDGVVHVPVQVDVGRAQRPGRPRRVPGRRGQLEPRRDGPARRRLRVDAERLDPRRPLVGPEVDPDAVDLDVPAAVSRGATSAGPRRSRRARCTTSRARPRGRRGTASEPRRGCAGRTTGDRAPPTPSPARRRSRRPGGSARPRPAAAARARPCPRGGSRAGTRSCARPPGPGSTGRASAHQPLEELVETALRVVAETRVHLGRLDDGARRRDEPVEAGRGVEGGDRPRARRRRTRCARSR